MQGLISEEQAMFGEAVRRFARQEYGFGPGPHGQSFDRARLARLGELGCLSLAAPEALGGFGGTALSFVALAALAPALPPEPVVASGIHAAALIAAAAPKELAQNWLADIAEGSLVAVVADLEHDARYDHAHINATARQEGDGYVLDGVKPMVPFGAQADLVLASAITDGKVALFAVDPAAAGVARTPRPRLDGLPAADIALSGCCVASAARLEAAPALDALVAAADIATAAQTAEMVGLMDALNAATIDNARTRKQFGVPIGSFQALQHRIADMWIAAEESRSLAVAAALACAEGADVRARTVSSAMLVACDAAEKIGNEAIQMHGGIGTTDELIVSHWYRRLWALRQELGDRRFHLGRLAA